ncbi:MAG: hypothetical protein ACOH19_16055 [Rhodoglobus sp.]
MAENSPIIDNRAERVLAFMVAASIGMSILALLVVMIASLAGGVDLSVGVWPVVAVLPLVGLPIGLVFMITLFIVSAIRRGRESKDAAK